MNYRSLYNEAMKNKVKENRLRSRIREIGAFYHSKGRMPSFSEIAEMTGFRSKNAVYKLVNKLEKLKVLERDDKGRLIALSIAAPVKLLGTVEAGFPSPAEEELAAAEDAAARFAEVIARGRCRFAARPCPASAAPGCAGSTSAPRARSGRRRNWPASPGPAPCCRSTLRCLACRLAAWSGEGSPPGGKGHGG